MNILDIGTVRRQNSVRVRLWSCDDHDCVFPLSTYVVVVSRANFIIAKVVPMNVTPAANIS